MNCIDGKAKLSRLAKILVKRLVKRLLVMLRKAPPRPPRRKWQEFSIGIYMGRSPFEFVPHEHVENPVLTGNHVSDVQASFVADPFMLHVSQTWYMFFEVMNRQTRKGEIGLATSADSLKWKYQHIVLAEPFHLSYPYVFQWMHNYYMIPESYQAGVVRLYKAVDFPDRWLLLGTLLSGSSFLDTSVFRHHDKWWLYTETSPDHFAGTLRLYYADDLLGPWHEHPQSPVIGENIYIARPAGRVVMVDERLFRFAQNCWPEYGSQVRMFEITELTTINYEEREVGDVPLLTGSGTGWNASGMHHIDPHPIDDGQWVACVDGFYWQ
jgi:hypothetical protein